MKRAAAPDLLLPSLVIGAALTVFAVAGFFSRTSQADFTMFYDSGRAWLAGGAPYSHAHANLNPPLVVAAVFAPLARLPYRAAQATWFIANLAAFLLSLRLVARALSLDRQETLCLVAAVSVTYPWCLLWFGGQVTFLLMLPFTKAWLALRRGQPALAGAWLAPVIVVKPPFALLALALPVPVWTVAGVLSAGAAGAGILWTGWQPWQEWLQLGGEVRWLSWADNASLWGVFTRAQSGWLGGGALSDIPRPAMVLLVAAGIAGFVRVRREGDLDRRLALSVLWLLLMLPLGWVYYVLIGLGPMRSRWPGTPWAWTSLILLAIPLPLVYPLLSSAWLIASLGSLYAAALLCGWIALTLPSARERLIERATPDTSHPLKAEAD